MTDDSNSRQKPPRPQAAQPEGVPVPVRPVRGARTTPAASSQKEPVPAEPLDVPEVASPKTGATIRITPSAQSMLAQATPESPNPEPLGSELLSSGPSNLTGAAVAQEANASVSDELSELLPELTPMFPAAAPFLARFLPHSPPTYAGLNESFCDLHAFLKHLHEHSWYGYLYAVLGDQAAYVLLYEGRTVTAAAASATGEQALGELLSLYEGGASLSAHPLSPAYAHVLSGIGSRAWKFNLTEDFTGLHARPTGAIFYVRGEIVATLPATLPYEGAFPAPLRPQTLILPRSLAGWAHHHYPLTLRGRDGMNAITDVYQVFKGEYGVTGLTFLKALSEKVTPADYAMRSDVALHDLETMVQSFLKTGYIREA
ncbi:hypothetical protein [Deinococcus arenicola]|uniref:Uncharacterized protein n=1 Tax=Deinococcus arenicola TaxID=2994950 RepID=A0ABU4DSY5_9DEIO|nr:hypothetical protein [Deinococcus sp. ZS9-10]MDV6375535.1 hypothetical protein [Deinococcus sp. ZS9-10]